MGDRRDDAQRFGEFRLGLAGEADDEVARQRDIGARRTHAIDQPEIAVAGVAAVHCLEHAVAA